MKGHTGPITGMTISSDGKRLAPGAGRGTVKVWDATSGQQLLPLKGLANWVWHLARTKNAWRRLAENMTRLTLES